MDSSDGTAEVVLSGYDPVIKPERTENVEEDRVLGSLPLVTLAPFGVWSLVVGVPDERLQMLRSRESFVTVLVYTINGFDGP